MTDPGLRDSLIEFQESTTSTNDYGEAIATAWTRITLAYARIRYGSGQERREAAQERRVQSATFECDWNPTLAGIKINNRIVFEGENWDITNVAPIHHDEIHFTGLRTD